VELARFGSLLAPINERPVSMRPASLCPLTVAFAAGTTLALAAMASKPAHAQATCGSFS
jgi:hypothetical protein